MGSHICEVCGGGYVAAPGGYESHATERRHRVALEQKRRRDAEQAAIDGAIKHGRERQLVNDGMHALEVTTVDLQRLLRMTYRAGKVAGGIELMTELDREFQTAMRGLVLESAEVERD